MVKKPVKKEGKTPAKEKFQTLGIGIFTSLFFFLSTKQPFSTTSLRHFKKLIILALSNLYAEKEICALVEAGFKYVTEFEGLKFFRKRKT